MENLIILNWKKVSVAMLMIDDLNTLTDFTVKIAKYMLITSKVFTNSLSQN